jgi:amino acid transporter
MVYKTIWQWGHIMPDKKITTVRTAVALGIGSMVGAGIFALMGEAAAIAGSGVWLSFLMAGIIALLTGHSFVELGVRYPTRGGIVEYLVRAYGVGIFSGGCSILYYIAQLIGMAMIAMAFGKFASKLIGIEENLELWDHVFASGLVLTLVFLTLTGSTLIRKVQKIFVMTNLVILAGFAMLLSGQSGGEVIHADSWPKITPLLGSLALTFFAFTGFAVISNAAGQMVKPERDLPRAMYTTIVIVMLLYLGVSLAVVGSVSAEELATSGPMLLVRAARAAFGEIGYYVLLISAVAATITCLNGGLFGVTNITFTLAEKGQLPSRFMKEVRASTRGLTISAVLALLMINFLSLSTVALLGGATTLMVYSLVNFGALRLITDAGLHRLLIILSVVVCVLTILIWTVHTFRASPDTLSVFFFFLVISFLAEWLLQRIKGRKIRVGAEAPVPETD